MALMKFREQNQVQWRGVQPAHHGTQVYVDATATNATVVIYTVPAGKTLYLCDIVLGFTGVAAGYAYIALFTAVPGLDTIMLPHFTAPAVDTPASVANYWPPLEIAAGWSLRLVSSAVGIGSWGTVHGWIE